MFAARTFQAYPIEVLIPVWQDADFVAVDVETADLLELCVEERVAFGVQPARGPLALHHCEADRKRAAVQRRPIMALPGKLVVDPRLAVDVYDA